MNVWLCTGCAERVIGPKYEETTIGGLGPFECEGCHFIGMRDDMHQVDVPAGTRLREPPTCECGALLPSGWNLCPTCKAMDRFGCR